MSKYRSHELSSPLPGNYTTALYKAKIEVFGSFFSGLILFKYNVDSNDYNIVLLSEVGLTICEFYSVNNTIEVRKASSLFQSKKAQGILAEDLALLIDRIPLIKTKSESTYKSNKGILYSTSSDDHIQQIRKRRLINGIQVELENYNKGIPAQVHFKNKGIGFSMKLKLIKVS